jgi:hypothetical protein
MHTAERVVMYSYRLQTIFFWQQNKTNIRSSGFHITLDSVRVALAEFADFTSDIGCLPVLIFSYIWAEERLK